MRPSLPSEVEAGLSLVEERLREIGQAKSGPLRNSILSTIAAGGKRIRPALLFLSGLAGEFDSENMCEAATAIELIHMATLIHDDVLDDAQYRRGLPTIRKVFSDKMAVTSGDSLFATAFVLISKLNINEIIDVISEAVVALSEGEMLQMKTAFDISIDERVYFEKIRKKTACLFSASCSIGAILGGCEKILVRSLANYGEALGLAFQIWDDVLDITGKVSSLGKGVGSDIADGTITLPMIFALEEGGQNGLGEILSRGSPGQADLAKAIKLIKKSDAIERAKAVAETQISMAKKSLEVVPDDLSETLKSVAKYVVERNS